MPLLAASALASVAAIAVATSHLVSATIAMDAFLTSSNLVAAAHSHHTPPPSLATLSYPQPSRAATDDQPSVRAWRVRSDQQSHYEHHRAMSSSCARPSNAGTGHLC